ncbi:MAG: hypothetical protein IT259_02840 [Saprospiraceae bacterium]|nr:hypothetical protein [Saprospiraceae bacterium]
MKTVFFLLLGVCLALSSPLFAQQSQPLVQEFDNGLINWTEQYVEASGFTIIDRVKYPNERQAVELARKGALAVARANLLEITQKVQVYRNTTVVNLVTDSDTVRSRVAGVISNALPVGKAKVDSDAVTVTIRMPLYGSNSLASAMQPVVRSKIVKTDTQTAPGAEMRSSKSPDLGEVSSLPVDQNRYVLQFKDGKFTPSLFPVMMDEEGNLLFDYSSTYQDILGNNVQYVNMASDLAHDLNWQKGVELIDAVQGSDGVIRVKTSKKAGFKRFLDGAAKVGRWVLPILTLL